MAQTIRIDPKTHKELAKLAKAKHLTLTETLNQAVERYRREVFLEEMCRGYAALRDDPEAWAEECKEREAWDVTNLDGLENE